MVLTGVDQLWLADITYIRLRDEFVFLAVILDAYSRRVIGWALDRTMEDELTLSALRMALVAAAWSNRAWCIIPTAARSTPAAITPDLLKDNGIEISMSRKGNPWDNAACESFMKTLKYEEVHRNEYRDLAEARRAIGDVSGKGLQPKAAALRARLPAAGRVRSQPRRTTEGGRCAAAFCMSFLKASGNLSIRCEFDRSGNGATPPPAHRLDEFPAGYSSAGCSPAGPASASPAEHQYALKSSCRSSIFSSNGQQCLNCLCQPRGPPHPDAETVIRFSRTAQRDRRSRGDRALLTMYIHPGNTCIERPASLRSRNAPQSRGQCLIHGCVDKPKNRLQEIARKQYGPVYLL